MCEGAEEPHTVLLVDEAAEECHTVLLVDEGVEECHAVLPVCERAEGYHTALLVCEERLGECHTVLLVDEGAEGLRICCRQEGAHSACEDVPHNQCPLKSHPFMWFIPLQW